MIDEEAIWIRTADGSSHRMPNTTDMAELAQFAYNLGRAHEEQLHVDPDERKLPPACFILVQHEGGICIEPAEPDSQLHPWQWTDAKAKAMDDKVYRDWGAAYHEIPNGQYLPRTVRAEEAVAQIKTPDKSRIYRSIIYVEFSMNKGRGNRTKRHYRVIEELRTSREEVRVTPWMTKLDEAEAIRQKWQKELTKLEDDAWDAA